MGTVLKWFGNLARHSRVNAVDLDGPERFSIHRQILLRKPMLQKVFHQFHCLFDALDRKYLAGSGLRVELGAGVAPIRDTFPDVLATDIVPRPGLDMVMDAQTMAFRSGSVRVLFGQNCFHHFPKPRQFFQEVQRVLVPGGGVILVEPYYGPLASLLFPHMFSSETFDKKALSWESPTTGPMTGANQALSFVVFRRDLSIFHREFPGLRLVYHGTCGNYLLYLVSGGLNFRQLLPSGAAPLLSVAQRLLSPLDRVLALHHVLVIRKLDDHDGIGRGAPAPASSAG